MSGNEVYRIAERHGVAALLVETVDDLEAFAKNLNTTDEDSVLLALYLLATGQHIVYNDGGGVIV